MKNFSYDDLGELADRIDSMRHALDIPLPADKHVEYIKAALGNVVDHLRSVVVEGTGDNPWEA
jgi:hypothetical protein